MLGKLAAPPPEPQTDGGSGTDPRQPQDHTHCRICGQVVPGFVEEGFDLYCPDHRPGSYSGPYAEPMDAEASKTCESARVFATASSLNRVRGRHHPGGPIFSPEPMDRGACESEGSQAPPIESYPSCGPRSSYLSRDGEDVLRAREEWLLLRHVELHDFLRDLLEMVTGWRIEDG